MKNGNLCEFLDNLYIGVEMAIVFENESYFIQGWNKENLYHLEVFNYYKPNTFKWLTENENPDICVKEFLDFPMWNGKRFYDVENQITWIDCSDL